MATVISSYIRIPGMNNTRDLGGMRTKDGRVIRPKMLYRSGRLSDLKDPDWFTQNVSLVVDMRSLQIMRRLCPVIFDGTHSVQLPGGLGTASGGQREFIPVLSRAAAAAGIDAIFMEVHPDPARALSDGPNSLDFAGAVKVLDEVKAIHELVGKMQ